MFVVIVFRLADGHGYRMAAFACEKCLKSLQKEKSNCNYFTMGLVRDFLLVVERNFHTCKNRCARLSVIILGTSM